MKTKLKDNTIFRWIIIPVCIALCFGGRFIPAVNGFTSDAWGVLFIFVGTLTLWLTIGIDWPSLLCIFALGFIPSIGFKSTFTSSFGNQTFIFLIFTFLCTYALSKTSLIKRTALVFVDSSIARKSGYGFIFMFLFAVLLLGMFISPSVLFVVMLPILDEILEVANISKEDKIAKMMMIGLGFTVSISSGMTTIAHVFPLLAMSAAEFMISPIEYMAFAIPAGFVLFILMFFVLAAFIRPDCRALKHANVKKLRQGMPSVSHRDIAVLVIFLVVLILWIIPSFLKDTSANNVYEAFKNYTTAMPPILGTLALCIIRIDHEPLLNIEDGLKNGIPWKALLMCAGALALGAALINKGVGITDFMTSNLKEVLKNVPGILLLIIFGLWAAIQTNLSSNMVTATLVATVASMVILSIDTGLHFEATICIIGMLASFAFATPPSMPHIAIIASSPSANTKDVLIYGSIVMILSVICALCIAYPLATLIL